MERSKLWFLCSSAKIPSDPGRPLAWLLIMNATSNLLSVEVLDWRGEPYQGTAQS